MNKLKLILPLLALLISSCATGRDSSTNSSEEGSNESLTSESSTSIVTSSSSEKQWEKHVSNRNPMNEPKVGRQFYLNHIGDLTINKSREN